MYIRTHIANCCQLLPHRFTLFNERLFVWVFSSIIDCELCTQDIGPVDTLILLVLVGLGLGLGLGLKIHDAGVRGVRVLVVFTQGQGEQKLKAC